jgi:hypothetical protein
MQDLIDFLQINSALVLANPITFSTFAVLFGGGGFLVGRYFLTNASQIWKAASPGGMTKLRRSKRDVIRRGIQSADGAHHSHQSHLGRGRDCVVHRESFTHTEDKIRLSQS